MNWNYVNPKEEGIYICDLGGDGVSFGWWDGKVWTTAWGNKILEIYGWIEVPKHLDRNTKTHKNI